MGWPKTSLEQSQSIGDQHVTAGFAQDTDCAGTSVAVSFTAFHCPAASSMNEAVSFRFHTIVCACVCVCVCRGFAQ